MRKILHLITGLEIGGTEKAILRTVPRLTNFEHIFCTLKGSGEVGEFLRQKGFKIYNLNPNGTFKLLPSVKFFRNIIDNEKPDVLITYLPLADIFGRIFGRIFGIKKIISYIRSRGREKKYQKVFVAEFLTSFLVTHYISLSQSLKNFYVQKLKIKPEKITVIPNGININNFFSPPASEIKKIKSELNIKKDETVIGTVSVLRPEKGINYLIKAISQITKNISKIKLIIIGDGPERKNLKYLVKKFNIADKVLFLGYRQDIPTLLHIFDIFVMPSIYEGMSNAILETMAAKRAVIASDLPENQELIENKKEGLLIPSKNSEALAKTIIQLSQDKYLREELSNNAYQKVNENFSLEKVVAQLDTFLKNLTR